MTEQQLHLFRLPQPRDFSVTLKQLALLDLIVIYDGTPLGDIVTVNQRPVLRRLIKAGLIKVVGLSPARYLITPIGRQVRGGPLHRSTG